MYRRQLKINPKFWHEIQKFEYIKIVFISNLFFKKNQKLEKLYLVEKFKKVESQIENSGSL